MKRLLALLLSIFLVFNVMGCGIKPSKNTASKIEDKNSSWIDNVFKNEGTIETTTETTVETTAEIQKYQLDEMVSTDLLDFTLHKATLSYAALGRTGKNFMTPCDPKDTSFVANLGETVVVLEYKITNKNRTTIGIHHGNVRVKLVYDGTEYDVYSWNGVGGLVSGVDYSWSAKSDNGYPNMDKDGSTMSYLLDANQTKYVRVPIIVKTDISDFNSSYDLVIELIDSNGNMTEFVYKVN